ncbi:carbohydrate porin [Planctomycetota bacterium]
MLSSMKFAGISSLLLLLVVGIHAEESPWLLGDWEGKRSELSEKGIDFEFLLIEFQVFNWLSIQPDLQYIVNPGMDPTLKDALVASLRAYIEF